MDCSNLWLYDWSPRPKFALLVICALFVTQVGDGNARGDVTILPTIVINNRQYRGEQAPPSLLL
jgi:hypothetical protein